MLEIKGLHVEVEGKEILKGINLNMKRGEIHALMGPNGSGKSSLSYTLMGHPKYKITKGKILLDGNDITNMSPDHRAKLGLFLALQYPMEIQGLPFSNFLFSIVKQRQGTGQVSPKMIMEFKEKLLGYMKVLNLDKSFVDRELNVGFSGGEKKRAEVLQLLMLQPTFAILDETDSGLDIDSLKLVANTIENLRGPNFGALVITHYQRLLNYVNPDVVHVLVNGQIVMSGGHEIVSELEKKGYSWLTDEKPRVEAIA